jgi:hypothetical protein
MRTYDVDRLFARYGWTAEEVEEGIWRSTFWTEREDAYDVYVMEGDEWLHFAVSPLVSRPAPACQGRLFATLLRLNQQMRLVRFAVDDEGDVNLLADTPRRSLAFPQFAGVLDALTAYTEHLAHELHRLGTEPDYHSPRWPEA